MPQQDGTTRRSDAGIGTGEAAERRPDDPVHDRQKPADARRLPGGGRRIASGYRDTAREIVSILFVSQAICRAGVLPGG